MKFSRILVAASALFASASAFAGFQGGVHYAPTYSIPFVSGATASGAFDPLGVGASLSAAFGAAEVIGLHVEGTYNSNTITSGSNRTSTGILILGGPKIWLGRFFSVFAGAGYNIGLTTASSPFNGAASGLAFGGGMDFDIHLGRMFAVFLGARYVYEMADLHTGSATAMLSTIQGMAGLRFGPHGK